MTEVWEILHFSIGSTNKYKCQLWACLSFSHHEGQKRMFKEMHLETQEKRKLFQSEFIKNRIHRHGGIRARTW